MSGEGQPQRVGRFEIRSELGRGAMGVVYEALDPTLDRLVALKAIRTGDAGSDEDRRGFEERFMTEARAAARLSHPGIVVVHEVGRDPESGTLFMALELLRGRTLSEIITARAPLEWREALALVRDAAQALHHAHVHGIVHRDVKPANIMVLETGGLKVMDFGIAKLLTADVQLTSTGQFFGTPLYMSPEQALGEPLDGRGDLFSLGVVAYQLLTGRRLFEADSVPRILTRIAYEPARPPSEVVPGLPAGVDAVLLRVLAKAPGERHADALAFAEDIDDVLGGRPPRHTAAAGVVAEATLVSAPTLPGPGGDVSGTADLHRPAAPESGAAAAEAGSSPASRRVRTGWIVGTLLFAAGLVTALVLSRSGLWGPAAGVGSPQALPATTTPAEVEPAGVLRIDFEHHFKNGRIRVWIDRELQLDEEFGGRVKAKIIGIKIRKGYFDAELPVPPGRHDVNVEVDWDDNERREAISGIFASGRTRTLKVRIDRILNRMSLDWS